MTDTLRPPSEAPGDAPARRRLSRLDLVRLGVLAAGVACVATGLLPRAEAEANLARIGPLLVFLCSVIVLAELTRRAGVFDVLARRLAILGRGRYPLLFVLCAGFAAVVTMTLNLDTTAVLLTPVLLALAEPTGIPPLPLAVTTLWLANTASLLLPVSNLTNLLAADRTGLDAAGFAARMWAPQLAALLVTLALLWVWYWRPAARETGTYRPPAPVRVTGTRQRFLLYGTGTAAAAFVVAIPFAGTHVDLAALGAAAIALGAYLIADRRALRWELVPWRLLVFVVGLFLVVPTVSRWGLTEVVHAMIGDDPGAAGAVRAAATGAGLSNLVNNLPAYTAGETVIDPAHPDVLLALLIGTNTGPLVTPWASLATLLCLEYCRDRGVRISLRRTAVHGLVLAVAATGAAVAALLLV
ncbi:SLC13 family permease [Nocardia thailandica]|uniref:SLC13 family permease n=1 Tax=Nocardia thailandica TaxID=257275 RepID=UPI0002EBC110|nr:SLC13 family permease [Nocardia thailandica]